MIAVLFQEIVFGEWNFAVFDYQGFYPVIVQL